MSGFAFSHQFSKRWLTTPLPVKHAIIQELDDIVALLQPETALDDYRFSVPNLNDTIDQLIADEQLRQHQAQQRQLEEQQRLEAEQLEQHFEQQNLAQQLADQQSDQRLATERLEQEQLERERLEQDNAEIAVLEQQRAIAKQAYLSQQTSLSNDANNLAEQADLVQPHASETIYAIDTQATTPSSQTAIIENDTEISTDTSDTSQSLAAAANNDDAGNHTTVNLIATPAIEKIKQDIVKQLQTHIDTYLLESLTLLNEDLSKWLSAEVDKQLNERLSP